jgi:hypothetical protein
MKRIILVIMYLMETPWTDFFWVLRTILNIPMILFHELAHLLVIGLTRCKAEIDPKKWYFLSKANQPYINSEGNECVKVGLGFAFPIAIQDPNPWKVLLVGAAPLLAILFDIFLCFYIPLKIHIPHFYQWGLMQLMIAYFAGNVMRGAWLSKDDINCIKTGWNHIKPKIIFYKLNIKVQIVCIYYRTRNILQKVFNLKKLFVHLLLWKDR